MSYQKYFLIVLLFVYSIYNSEGNEATCKATECIHVEIFYESLCGDSMRFIKSQLAPSYSNLKDHLNISFVPYGKASHRKDQNNKWKFICQHGEEECNGNKIHACTLDKIQKNYQNSQESQDLSVKFVKCMMSKYNPHFDSCAEEVGLSTKVVNEVNECRNSNEGNELLVKHGEKTHAFQSPLSFVPTILINRESNDAAFDNFNGIICSRLKTKSC